MSGNTTKKLNLLAQSASPYLRQHAADPVDWKPWCNETISEAKRRDVPIFLSVGYAACHWCHVMQHEVFQNTDIAEVMNARFVNIKVDREERPDIDEAYMLATQLLTGAGGWPMSVWLTPELKPLYAGTYFPPNDTQGRPGFLRLTEAISTAWQTNREKAVQRSDEIWAAMQEAIQRQSTRQNRHPTELFDSVLASAEAQFDFQYGGFQGSPKFPPHQMLLFWVQILERHRAGKQSQPRQGAGDSLPQIVHKVSKVEQMLTLTLDHMQWGGIHDLVGGGFARYSTDARWHVPHFEKMLYDNAQLAEVYARASTALHRPDYASTAERILDFWLNNMSDRDGLCFSSLDADSDGQEGKYYIWTWDELNDVLASQPGLFDLAAQMLDISRRGNWDGANVLQLSQTGRESPSLRNEPRWQELTALLEATRRLRTAPQTDDKIITAWNGLMLSALASGARLGNGGRFRAAGKRLMDAIRKRLLTAGGMVLRSVCGPTTGGAGFLDDYAYLARGLIDWAGLNSGDRAEALDLAGIIIDKAIVLFTGADGALHTSADDHQSPLRGMRADFDNAVPSPSAVLVGAMLDFNALAHCDRYTKRARDAIEGLLGTAAHYPTASATILAVLERHSSNINAPAQADWRAVSTTAQDDAGFTFSLRPIYHTLAIFSKGPNFNLYPRMLKYRLHWPGNRWCW